MLELSADAGRRVHATTGAGEQSLVGVARLDGAWRGDETKGQRDMDNGGACVRSRRPGGCAHHIPTRSVISDMPRVTQLLHACMHHMDTQDAQSLA